jgi:hypothetical protein
VIFGYQETVSIIVKQIIKKKYIYIYTRVRARTGAKQWEILFGYKPFTCQWIVYERLYIYIYIYMHISSVLLVIASKSGTKYVIFRWLPPCFALCKRINLTAVAYFCKIDYYTELYYPMCNGAFLLKSQILMAAMCWYYGWYKCGMASSDMIIQSFTDLLHLVQK